MTGDSIDCRGFGANRLRTTGITLRIVRGSGRSETYD
jgi:hypothetical protein